MPDTIPVGKYYNFDNKNVDVVYNPAKDENKGSSGGGGVFVVNITGDLQPSATFDKTAAEVFAAKQTMPVVVTMSFNGATALGDLVVAKKQGTNYRFFAYVGSNDLIEFTAASDDSYPVHSR